MIANRCWRMQVFLIAVFLATGTGLLPRNVSQAHAQESRNTDKSAVYMQHVQGRVYMLTAGDSNITVQIGDEGIVVVDTSVPQMSDQILSAVRSLSSQQIKFIINTSADADHTGGNRNLARAGHFNSGLNGEIAGASIIAHENTLEQMTAPSGREPPAAQDLWPTDTYDTDDWAVFNDEAIVIEHPHAAHTDGDSIVFFRRSDVISAGDIFTPDHYPVIDTKHGGTINGEIDALNRLLHIMVPKKNEEGGTYVIPGHGRLCDRAPVTNYRDMVTIIRDRVADMIKRGKTLEETKAAKLTLDYDGIYGADRGPWATNTFIETVYHDLSLRKGQLGQ